MIDFRKLLVTIVIAVLFAIFVQTVIDAIVPSPDYNIYCGDTAIGAAPTKVYFNPDNLTPQEQQQNAQYAQKQKDCQAAFDAANKQHQFVVFLVSAIAGLIATILGMYVPVSTPVGMSVASGLILGGIFSLFFGTVSGWGGINLIARPFIILVELAVVIYVAYKQLNKPIGVVVQRTKLKGARK